MSTEVIFFRAAVAKEVGVGAAIVLERITHWCRHNQLQGLPWECTTTLETLERINEVIPRRSIQRHLQDLEASGMLIVRSNKKDKKKTFVVDETKVPFGAPFDPRCAKMAHQAKSTETSDSENDCPDSVKKGYAKMAHRCAKMAHFPNSLDKRVIKKEDQYRDQQPGADVRQIGHMKVWAAYCRAHEARYDGATPEQTQRQIAWCKTLVKVLGEERAIIVAGFYPTTSKERYPDHPLTLAIRDAEILAKEARTGKASTVISRRRDDLRQNHKEERDDVLAIVDRMMKKGGRHAK